MQNPFQKIDKHLIMNQIFDYLYFKDIVQLSKTNQEFYKMFKLTLEKFLYFDSSSDLVDFCICLKQKLVHQYFLQPNYL